MIPLDLMGKLDGFGESFDLAKYYEEREAVFEDMISYSQQPEARSARESIQQILNLADKYDSDAGRLFRSVYERIIQNENS